jgi:hypothetical protein
LINGGGVLVILDFLLKDDLQAATARVREANNEREEEQDAEEQCSYRIDLTSNDPILSSGKTEQENQDQLSLVSVGSRAVAVLGGSAAEYFLTRTFQGLVESTTPEQSTEIHAGQFGIASEYIPLPSEQDKSKQIFAESF